MPYSAKSIANFFLDQAESHGQPIDPLKLQKLVYYAQGWYAGHTDEPLIGDTVEAWPYGPVIPALYHAFKQFGSRPIHGRALESGSREVDRPQDPKVVGFLENVWNGYSPYSSLRLSEMTHASDGPWDLTRRPWRGSGSPPIPFEVLRAHFSRVVETMRGRQQ